jgi:hypothetical protein
MSFSDEVLMAYADGELEPAVRDEVEQAMRRDPEVAAAVERHRALRADVFAAFAGVLDEPVPERLQPHPTVTAPAPADGPVRIDALAAAGARPLAPRWRWPQWGAMAASLAVGVLSGVLGWRNLHGADADAPVATRDGALVAQGQLADVLSRQLASTSANANADGKGPRVGLSFRARDGHYCRSFQLGASAGLACREGGQWRIPVLAEGEREGGAYRQAGNALPPAVLDAIDGRIAGGTLDAAAERAASGRGWEP